MLIGAENVAADHLPGAGKVSTAPVAPHHSHHTSSVTADANLPLPKLAERRF